MASIFTYDPNPPRVSSPWLNPIDDAEEGSKPAGRRSSTTVNAATQPALLSETGVTKLEAEPQEGPTEYKLHLLLRQRRKYSSSSTAFSKPKQRLEGQTGSRRSTSAQSPSTHNRQARLEQLTTQLLWRLQQSSPYHASSSNEMVIPVLPDNSVDLDTVVRPAALIPGLEESRGALYEIGVADDGTLVGLTMDEMDESIRNLGVMAASLGCKVEVLRMVIVGDCEWVEAAGLVDNLTRAPEQAIRKGKLWVAEAFVSPDFGHRENSPGFGGSESSTRRVRSNQSSAPRVPASTTDQLRITLTGPTTSGKSTLLGTLSTGTLDNGRGKSRLSLLRHRHEVASGMTSAMSPELVGYKDGSIFNYTDGNIESWIDIHDRSQSGRLVFVADSAGHPRYRRTILRGLVGWSPQWTVLCIGADQFGTTSGGVGATSSAVDVLGSAGAAIDLVQAHLNLCLKMEVPLAIAITKLDLASGIGLKQTVSKVLTAIKSKGRTPKLIPPNQKSHYDLAEIPREDVLAIDKCLDGVFDLGYLLQVVPIVITSAVNGSGIGQIHALFQRLPIPPAPTAHDYVGMALNPEQPTSLFHIDDTFNLAGSQVALGPRNTGRDEPSIVISGYLRFGKLSVGDAVVVGPFPAEDEDAQGSAPDPGQSSPSHGLSISHPASAELYRVALRNAVSASTIKGEWHNADVISVRNLRLPVHTLEAGQVGSLGIQLDIPEGPDGTPAVMPRVRRGMVAAIPSSHMAKTGLSLQAASGLTASFKDSSAANLVVGSLVNIYVVAVRAAARVVHVMPGRQDSGTMAAEDVEDVFDLETDASRANTPPSNTTEVLLDLLSNREWIELGSKIVVLEGGSKDKSGLESVVGTVVEVVD
ncbi:hypothetical protein MKZ38_002508 [Zalerion maritima]|uniref:Tr-type G domain-containing protein n=1 Tax=Zalerion maritima TaxID=339359 RepID=A0AAD5RPM2_9PEZI|nr:hypothetical protein MKZ38_002508 [Zalerion maritima]